MSDASSSRASFDANLGCEMATTLRAAPARPQPPKTSAEAFERVRPRLEAMPVAEVQPIQGDVPTAASIALGAAERLVELRSAIVEHLPTFDLAHVVDLSDLALAAWYAHLLWAARNRRDDRDFDELLTESTTLRRTLLADADALVARELVNAERVAEIREGQGHLDTANDLVALSSLFAEAWQRIQGRTAARRDEVDHAAELGVMLIVALSRRSDGSEGPPVLEPFELDEMDLRARAFTLLHRSYEQCRRAVSYLRWDDGDASDIVPPLRPSGRPEGGITGEPQPSDDGFGPEIHRGPPIVTPTPWR